MVGWLLNFLYLFLCAGVAPIILWKRVRYGKYRHGWPQKLLGRLPQASASRETVWFHAVSVGEVLQLRTIVRSFQQRCPHSKLLITTSTSTGFNVARETFPDCSVSYFPLDFTWAVREALRRVRPALVVLVELELWPNFIREAASRKIPLALINGRMSARSYGGYRKIRWLIRPLLRRFACIAVQTETYAARLKDLGAPNDRVIVSGSIKFDGVCTDRNHPKTLAIRQAFGIGEDERVFIAGSTHAPEEQIALNAYAAIQREFPDVRLVLVPRHAERFNEVAALIESSGFPVLRRSRSGVFQGGPEVRPVCLLDTLGELSACWGLADVAFVGGSLMKRGGQNMMEPAGYGAAVIVGSHTHNFRDVVDGLQSCGALRVIEAPNELAKAVRELLQNPDEANSQGMRGREFVLAQQGATERTVAQLVQLLGPRSKIARRAA